MKLSQRSESINAFFDGFVHNSTPLYEFIDQYDKAISYSRDKEKDEDFIFMTTKADLTKLTLIDSHASQVYTKNVFHKFKEEFDCVFHCRHEKLKKDGDESTYQVTYNYDDKAASHVVKVIPKFDFKCSCAKFETAGLLCKHILYLMKKKIDLTSIPERYILKIWTLAARYNTSNKVEFLVAAVNCLRNLSKQLDEIEIKQGNIFTELDNQVMSQTSQITIRDPAKCKTPTVNEFDRNVKAMPVRGNLKNKFYSKQSKKLHNFREK
ncbi:hypothetical protein AgCh_012025 [Apium graveolens]